MQIRGAGYQPKRRRLGPASIEELDVIVENMPEKWMLMMLLASWCALRYGEIVGAMVAAASVRALVVGLLTWVVAIVAQGEVLLAHVGYAIAFPVLTSIGLSALGLFVGIWAEKFEHVNLVPTFVITPLTFLGGVFYDVGQLPGVFATLSHFNPVLYLVEGLRYGLLGTSVVPPGLSLAGLAVFDAGILFLCMAVLRSGWKLRS